MRTLSILKTAKARGVIGEVSPILDKMIQKGRWYSNEVVEKFLNSIGE
jgi:predicted nucleic acid-binding protein